jgi:polyphosphate glucokinase
MKHAIGIDIGGTGIKGALVNLKKGELATERLRFDTPDGGKPNSVVDTVVDLVNLIDAPKDTPIGICFPAPVKHGVTLSAANVSDEWIGLQAGKLFSKALGGDIVLLNDADAAGVAEIKFGAGKGENGLILMCTLGTGIGSALFMNGKLIPNSELGHIEIDGVDYETKAAYSAKERGNLSFEQWSKVLSRYFDRLNKLLYPDLIIIGGGVSKEYESFLHLIESDVKIVPARSKNNAGIIGAAYYAAKRLSKD